MKILFITIGQTNDLSAKSIYPDLIREIKRRGHEIVLIRVGGQPEKCYTDYGTRVINICLDGIRGSVSGVKKGIAYLVFPYLVMRKIKKYLGREKFHAVIYSTPPVTISKLIEKLKKKYNNAMFYLLQKDYFPHIAADTGTFSRNGIIFKIFRFYEKKLYRISDFIGTMSEGCRQYLIKNNPYIDINKVEINPNALDISMPHISGYREKIRNQFGIASDKVVFLYGGNIGRAQGVEFIARAINKCRDIDRAHFLIIASGEDKAKMEKMLKDVQNITILDYMETAQYEKMVSVCDVGLVFLYYGLTVPNIPSRILPYMEYEMPILSAEDTATDLGEIIEKNGLGLWCYSNDPELFRQHVEKLAQDDELRKTLGKNAKRFLEENYTTEISCDIIFKHIVEEVEDAKQFKHPELF